MGFLREFGDRLAGVDNRSISYQQVWGSGGVWEEPTGSKQVSVEAAIGFPSLLSAVDLIAGQIAAMPLRTYRHVGEMREQITDGPLVSNPSDVWAADEWRYVACASMLLHGEAIGVTTRTGSNGWPAAIEWVDPRRVNIERREDGSLLYTINDEIVPSSTVMHIKHGMLLPGAIRGRSPVKDLRTSISIGLESLMYEHEWFAGGAHPSGVLSVDVPALSEEQADEIISRFVRKTKARRPVALAKIASYQSIQADPSGAGLELTKRRVANDIANAFHIPPELIGGNLGDSLTYANLETHQQTLDLRALMPVYTKLERAISRVMPKPTYVKFNADAMLRTDSKTRTEIAEMQLRSGQRTIDEVRAKDELGAIAEAPGYESSLPVAAMKTTATVTVPSQTTV